MSAYPQVFLKKGKEFPVLRFHPWVFSGAIHKVIGNPQEGSIVECFSFDGAYLATGHYMQGSLAIKLFSFVKQEIDYGFWKNKIAQCWQHRKSLGFTDNLSTTAYRLIHNEGDMMPGLIVDIYGGLAVFQAHTLGMYQARESIAKAIIEVSGGKIQWVYDKSSEALKKMLNLRTIDGFLIGEAEEYKVLENNHTFIIEPIKGQKTGFFLDQRENRALVAKYAQGRTVLNMFSYTGGFSVYAAMAGAREVVTVDSSAPAVSLAVENLKVNGCEGDAYVCMAVDAKKYLEEMPADRYDLIILDPPAYAKNMAMRNQALKGYRNINALAMKKIKKGGILFTFSCSQVVERSQFYSAITAAAIDAGRQVKVLHQLSQPADHPINIFHQEGEYLKGLVLLVEN